MTCRIVQQEDMIPVEHEDTPPCINSIQGNMSSCLMRDLFDTITFPFLGCPISDCPDLRMWWSSKCHHEDVDMANKLDALNIKLNNALDHGKGVGKKCYTRGKAFKVARDSKLLSMTVYGEERCNIDCPRNEETFKGLMYILLQT